MTIILLFGAPGAGKGTQADMLKKELPCKHLSSGEIMRDILAQKPDSQIAQTIKQAFARGVLVAPEIVNNIISDSITANTNHGIHSILDGYPRSIEQDEYLRREVDGIIDNIKLAIYLKIDKEILITRLLNRVSCKDCGTIYNKIVLQNAGKDTICGKCNAQNFVTRLDDTDVDTINKRFEIFEQETMPVLKRYEKMDSFHVFDANRDASALSRDLLDVVSKVLT